ncbi:MAG: flagellar export protein FliJ [Anaerolineae bacterium]|nr:flagellar export protein FliJ [Anaerolineae bacterium]
MFSKKGFPLQSILKFKSNAVDTLEAEFGHLKVAHKNRVDTLQNLQQVKNQEMVVLQQLQQNDALDCGAIQRQQQYIKSIRTKIIQQVTLVEEVQLQLESKRQELAETMQDQKTLENLRDRYQTNQSQVMHRRETRTIDELVITRYGRER